MKRILAITATVLTVLGTLTMTSAPANATADPPPPPMPSSIVDLTPAPKNYWTPTRMTAAKDVSLPTVGVSKMRQAKADPPPFPLEKQRTIAYPEWPKPIPADIIHDGLEHPRTVGKILSKKYITEDGAPITKDDACTGTVVNSESGSIIITAGHCVWPQGHTAVSSHFVFIPAYHVDQNDVIQQPFGTWDITAAITPDCWRDDKTPSCDQAFLKAVPRDSDQAQMEGVVGSMGLTVGGQPVRGATPIPEAPNYTFPPLTMHSYPEFSPFSTVIPDKKRVYKCEGTSAESNQETLLGGVQIICSEPIIGGASGAAFIEYLPGGATVIATFKGSSEDNRERLFAKLNDTTTEAMYNDLDDYTLS